MDLTQGNYPDYPHPPLPPLNNLDYPPEQSEVLYQPESRKRKSYHSDHSDHMPRATSPRPEKTKRFVWPPNLHRSFVSAVFSAGLSATSPAQILACMGDGDGELTKERVKSHLQKFRAPKANSREVSCG